MRFVLQFGLSEPSENIPLAIAAEKAGFDALACADSLFYPKHSDGKYPYTADGDRSFIEKVPFIDPGVCMSAWAAVTSKVRFYPSVYKLPTRHPVHVAKVYSSLAVMSNERLSFGVGSSPWEEDFKVFDLPFAHRGARMEECIEIFRGLMKGAYFSYSGKFYQFPEIKLNPVPKKPIPILIGGHVDIAMRRAARIGDGWISANVPYETLKPLVVKMKQYLREAGTERSSFEIHGFDVDITDAATARRTAELGVTDAQIMPWMMIPTPTLQQKIDSVNRFGNDVIAKFK